MKTSEAVPCLLLLLGTSLLAQSKTTRIRGTVEDANTRRPIGGATVSASGDTAQKSEVTDDNGFFRLVIEGVVPGDLVRLRVVKPGYIVYDLQIVTSEEIPIIIDLRRSTPAAGPAPPRKPLVSSDPVTTRYIQEMTTQNNPVVRLNALKVIVKSAATDPAALAAVAAAINDGDYDIRQMAAYDLGQIGKPTPEVITALRIAASDPEPDVRIEAIRALGRFRHNKDAVDALIHIMGTPPNINAWATMTLHNEGIDDPRLLAALIYEATTKNDKNAAVALGQLHQNKSAVDALFAALGTPPKINIGAMNALEGMGIDDPRLMAALIDQAVKGNDDAITALGQYPQKKEAVEALFRAMGGPPSINLTAMNVLGKLGIDDPRLTEAWITEATTYDSETGAALLKKAPFPPDTITRLIAHLAASLHTPRNWITQIDLSLLLRGGEPAHEALHAYLASVGTSDQSQIAVAWLEADHSAAARAEILQNIRVPDVQTMLLKITRIAGKEFVSLPEAPSMKSECTYGLSLRAAMGLVMLDLAPRDHPLNILISVINEDHEECSTYAAVVIGWLGPDALNRRDMKAALPGLIKGLDCQHNASPEAALNSLAEIGDLNTLSEISQMAAGYQPNCYRLGGGPFLNQERMNDLSARIRARMNAK